MIKLNLDSPNNSVITEVRSRLTNVYSRLAGDDDYNQNLRQLGLIQVCVITVSAVATGGTNAFAHHQKLGYAGAAVLALFIMAFVEVFYFTLRHGLATVYKGTQRVAARFCYRTIQATMVLNGAVLCTWVVGVEMPPLLQAWNRWSIVVHFTLALVGVSAVRDSDPVAAHAILKLKTETARQDLETLRQASELGNPFVVVAARLRGLLDGLRLAWRILRGASEFASVSGNSAAEPPVQDALLLSTGETSINDNKVVKLGKPGRR